MALMDADLFVKKSTLPGTGKGLFTKVFIPKGTRITEYKGRVMTWKQVEAEVEDHIGYVFWFSDQHVIDAWKTKDGVAHYANDARGLVKTPGIVNNSEYETEKDRCYIASTRDIPAGSEILVAYGREYWSVIRYNMRLEQKSVKK
jgi:SET domain-containing protein